MTILESLTKFSNSSMNINKINSTNNNNYNNIIIQQSPFIINIFEKSICTAIIPHNEIERKMPIFKRLG
ncbi:hypothetical protein RB653_000296 [Dictyostelium firmibasis]|uniref:Uncharacterized protein n=1 Tax=Dictyostelium firmibasis TaxID=79012 RepID=A0AAN7Z126_9MYCE